MAPLFYGIFNFGSVVLTVLGAFFLLLPLLWKWGARVPRLRAVAAVLVGAFLVYCLFVSGGMAYKAWFDHPPETGEATVVVLGAKVNGDQPSLMLRRRLNKALEYMKVNPEAICVVTGGQGADEEFPEAQVMGDYLVSRGIDAERVIREDRSTSTRENFRFAAELLREREGYSPETPVIVVTDAFHQLRASIFAKAELGAAPQELYAISSSTPWGLIPAYWVRDMLGVAVAWLQTR